MSDEITGNRPTRICALALEELGSLLRDKRLGKTRSLGFDTLSATLRATQPAVASQGLP